MQQSSVGIEISNPILEGEASSQWVRSDGADNTEAISGEWAFHLNSQDQIIPQGHSLLFDINGIVTDLPTGLTHLYVRYENIPGYWDGQFVVEIAKQPLVMRKQTVGIGTIKPSVELEVAGAIRSKNVRTNTVYSYDSTWHRPKASIDLNSESGNIGINNSNPQATLDVTGDGHFSGTLNVSGLSVSGDRPKDATGYIMPPGGIIMWSGSVHKLPEGWRLCDGKSYKVVNGEITEVTNPNSDPDVINTPDLADRFIMGVNEDKAVNDGFMNPISGEPDTHTHLIDNSTDNQGPHDHKMPSSWKAYGMSYSHKRAGIWLEGYNDGDHLGKKLENFDDFHTQKDGTHSHKMKFDSKEPSGNQWQNKPKWYALCFIMKI